MSVWRGRKDHFTNGDVSLTFSGHGRAFEIRYTRANGEYAIFDAEFGAGANNVAVWLSRATVWSSQVGTIAMTCEDIAKIKQNLMSYFCEKRFAPEIL